MEFYTADKYTNLPRSTAYNKFLDDKNLKSFRTYLVIATVFFTLSLVTDVIGNFSIGVLVVMLINIAFLVITRLKYEKLLNSGNIRKFLYGYLIAQIIFACLINVANIVAGPGEDPDEQILLPDSSAVSDSSSTADSIGQRESGSTHKDKDTVWVSEKGNMKVTVDLSNNYDTFAEWLLVLSIMLIIFSFPRDELYKLWALALVLPVISEFIIYGSLDMESYLGYGSFYALFFIIAFFTERSTRKKFNKQYDFYLKKNFENIRMKKELDSAKEIQLSMLPESNSIINEVQISGISLPAKEVGGDYFDYFRLSDTKLGVFICDVSGHGVASGLMLSGLRSSMHLVLEDEDDPRIIMEKLNRMVRKTQQRKMFVTAVFALIDTEKNECRLFNAGHLPPYKISGSAGEIFKIKKHGITLGAIDNISIPNHESEVVFDFNRGDKIVFYTDGLSEAMDKVKQEYGFERIENLLQQNTDKTPAELIDILNNDVRNFIGESEQIDDLTILIIGR